MSEKTTCPVTKSTPTCTTISYTSNSLAQHQLRSSGRLFRPLAPLCAGPAIDRRNRSIKIESHPKKTLVRAPKPKPRSRPRSKTEAAEPASLSRSPTDCVLAETCAEEGLVCLTHQQPEFGLNGTQLRSRQESSPVRSKKRLAPWPTP